MKVIVDIEDRDVFLLVGTAQHIGFKRKDPKAIPSDIDKQDAMRFLFSHFVDDLKVRMLDKMKASLEIAEKINASSSIRIKE